MTLFLCYQLSSFNNSKGNIMKYLLTMILVTLSFSSFGQEDPRETKLGQAKCKAAKRAKQKLKRLYSIQRMRDTNTCLNDSDCTNSFVGGLCPQPANVEAAAIYQVYMESTAYQELNQTIMTNCYVALPGCMVANKVICRNNRCVGQMRRAPMGPRSIR
jgi:hypothetical protein